jgi:drug/metabolite transporter (DMT)-like permease
VSERFLGVALIATSAACFGALAVLAKLAYVDGADPIGVLFGRFLIAGLAMLVLLRVRGQRLPRGRVLVALVLLGGVGYVGQSLTFFSAAALAPAGLISLLLYVYPAIVTIVSVVLFKESLGVVKVFALVIALAGTVLTLGETGQAPPLGIALGLLSAAAYATYILVSSRVAPRAGAIPAATVVINAATVSYAVLAVVTRPALPRTTGGWLAVAGLALICTVVAFVTFLAGLERVGAADASTLSTLEPAVTIALAALLLGESVRAFQLVGGALILAGVVILSRTGSERVTPPDAPAQSTS